MENANKMQPAKIDWDKERSEPGWKTNERFVNRGSTGLERCQQLSDIFEKRKTAILNHIRSVHTKNLQSVSMDEINDAMQKYESWTKTQKGKCCWVSMKKQKYGNFRVEKQNMFATIRTLIKWKLLRRKAMSGNLRMARKRRKIRSPSRHRKNVCAER